MIEKNKERHNYRSAAVIAALVGLSTQAISSISGITIHADNVVTNAETKDNVIESNKGKQITIYYGDTIVNQGQLPEPLSLIRNPELLPKGTTAEYKKIPELSRPGDYPGQVRLTYPNGTTQDYHTRIHVRDSQTGFDTGIGVGGTQSGEFRPKGDDIITMINGEPSAADAITNKADLPEGTTFKWKSPIDTTVAGDREAFIVVTYPDKSIDEVKIAVHVDRNGSFKISYFIDSAMFPAKGQDVTTYKGTPVDAKEGISNKNELPNSPEEPMYSWKKTPDWNTVGTQPAIVLVDYPDGTRNEVKINVHVLEIPDNEKYSVEPQRITTEVNSPADIASGIKNYKELPEGTTLQWIDEPDWSKGWSVTENDVKVIYPDGTEAKTTVPVTIYDKLTGQDIHVDQNAKANAEDGINPDSKNDNMKYFGNFTYTWKEEPDTSKGGIFPATIIVKFLDNIYPEGLTYEVDINVHVDVPWAEIGPSTPVEKPSIPWTDLEPSKPIEKPKPEKPSIPWTELTPAKPIEKPVEKPKPEPEKPKEDVKAPEKPAAKPVETKKPVQKTLLKTNAQNSDKLSTAISLGIAVSATAAGLILSRKKREN